MAQGSIFRGSPGLRRKIWSSVWRCLVSASIWSKQGGISQRRKKHLWLLWQRFQLSQAEQSS